MVFDLLGKGIRQPGKPSHSHPHGQILALSVTGRNVFPIRLFATCWTPLDKRNDRKSMRDRALLRCLFRLGTSPCRGSGLDLEDLDRDAGTVAVLGKAAPPKRS